MPWRDVASFWFSSLFSSASSPGVAPLHAQAPSAQAVVIGCTRGAGRREQARRRSRPSRPPGCTRQIRGNNLVPIEFEINCQLPDKFVRKDEIPAQDTDASVTGFCGRSADSALGPAGARGRSATAGRLAQQRLGGHQAGFRAR